MIQLSTELIRNTERNRCNFFATAKAVCGAFALHVYEALISIIPIGVGAKQFHTDIHNRFDLIVTTVQDDCSNKLTNRCNTAHDSIGLSQGRRHPTRNSGIQNLITPRRSRRSLRAQYLQEESVITRAKKSLLGTNIRNYYLFGNNTVETPADRPNTPSRSRGSRSCVPERPELRGLVPGLKCRCFAITQKLRDTNQEFLGIYKNNDQYGYSLDHLGDQIEIPCVKVLDAFNL
ncbi:hypothetical protein WA026_020380 [Henosepilachna vigintioctopunctata]|uniref:Uncharacterized protein n=1 Tax=Henosepilachna vigintioctopunctata TaxID=420089 RepID=A0AAW1UGU2_9CUCU